MKIDNRGTPYYRVPIEFDGLEVKWVTPRGRWYWYPLCTNELIGTYALSCIKRGAVDPMVVNTLKDNHLHVKLDKTYMFFGKRFLSHNAEVYHHG